MFFVLHYKRVKAMELNTKGKLPHPENWKSMHFYEKFEHIVSIALTVIISIVIIIAFLRLIVDVYNLLIVLALNPIEHSVFQTIFGMIMTLLITLEFKHSILQSIFRRASIVQVRTVMLIAILALARKFIILDVKTESPAIIAALSGALLVAGIVFWLIKEREDSARYKNR